MLLSISISVFSVRRALLVKLPAHCRRVAAMGILLILFAQGLYFSSRYEKRHSKQVIVMCGKARFVSGGKQINVLNVMEG